MAKRASVKNSEHHVTQHMTRRDVLLRALTAGTTGPLIVGLLAACDQMDDDDTGQKPATATRPATEPPTATPTTEAATQSPTSRVLRPTSTQSPVATTSPTATLYPPDPKRHFELLSWSPSAAANPHIAGRNWETARLCLEPLFEFDADLNPVLLLAAEWPTFENGLLDPGGALGHLETPPGSHLARRRTIRR